MKLNIAEILKDCPKGMELGCTCADNVVFDKIIEYNQIKCVIGECRDPFILDKYGRLLHICCPKCVIFPKGKTSWEGFQRSFKDGDIAISDRGDIHLLRTADSSYCAYRKNFRNPFDKTITTKVTIVRLATEEEKQKLFDAIKANGYKWYDETKTLEKLIEPKFKVGDKVKNKDGYVIDIIEIDTNKEEFKYKTPIGAIGEISFNNQNNYELVPNKFDITTLKPFDKVLVRDNNGQKWTVDMFSFYDKTCIYPFNCIGHYVNQCIPYESNEHLLGTTDDCDEYYKTWE